MVFSSAVFLFAFLPSAFALALLSRRHIALQNALLAAISVAFYAWGSPVYAVLLIVSVALNYALARIISNSGDDGALNNSDDGASYSGDDGTQNNNGDDGASYSGDDEASYSGDDGAQNNIDAQKPKKKRLALFAALAFNIGLLCVMKYAGFFIANINRIPGVALPPPNIPLPIGISFFTFQAMSYVIDVYKGNAQPQRNFVSLLLYISFFPQLIAGPIVRYADIEPMLGERRMTPAGVAYGLRRFIAGLAKKLLLADTLGAVADKVFGAWAVVGAQAGAGAIAGASAAAGAISGASAGAGAAAGAAGLLALPAWIGAFAYAFQIFFDFAGYSDMAIGLGRMLGFKFRENFAYPYAACGMRDFWRRWHISLSTWFKEYVYIPLGGNRRGRLREGMNKLIVFFLTGLWHGANWTFVLWGMFHGFFLTLESFGAVKTHKMPKPVTRLYTLLVVTVGFVLFRSETVASGLKMVAAMFTGWTSGGAGSIAAEGPIPIAGMFEAADPIAASATQSRFMLNIAQTLPLLPPSVVAAFVAAAAASAPIAPAILKRFPKLQLLWFAASIPLLLLCAMKLASDGYNPFIYFRF